MSTLKAPVNKSNLIKHLAIVVLLTMAGAGTMLAGGKKTMSFASEMAKRGNWREASYRWSSELDRRPENPRILNNLAVASEVLGDTEKAGEYYDRALQLAPGDPAINDNVNRYRRFWNTAGEGSGRTARVVSPQTGKPKKQGLVQVEAMMPVPARVDLSGKETLLVASFLTIESDLLDTNRELVRYLRAEFNKKGPLEVLEVVPAPAIPEQRLEDLVNNFEFWRHLGREYDADIIVTGRISFDRQDASSFQDVDYVSPRTGQKVRQTRFVEQEQFTYAIVLLIFDGRSGELLFRDNLNRSVIFGGLSNDPITAFYHLADSLAEDFMAVVSPRKRAQYRFIFRD